MAILPADYEHFRTCVDNERVPAPVRFCARKDRWTDTLFTLNEHGLSSLLASNQWLLRCERRHHDPVADAGDTVTLWRPTGPEELALVEASGWREWPPRLPGQPIFYPVLNENYAAKIARDWNVPHSGAGYVTRFQVRRSFLDQYEVRQAGGKTILEYWIPADDLSALNASIVGTIEVTAEYR
jgi:hypothetical protein